jgi:hypothetical protein
MLAVLFTVASDSNPTLWYQCFLFCFVFVGTFYHISHFVSSHRLSHIKYVLSSPVYGRCN